MLPRFGGIRTSAPAKAHPIAGKRQSRPGRRARYGTALLFAGATILGACAARSVLSCRLRVPFAPFREVPAKWENAATDKLFSTSLLNRRVLPAFIECQFG